MVSKEPHKDVHSTHMYAGLNSYLYQLPAYIEQGAREIMRIRSRDRQVPYMRMGIAKNRLRNYSKIVSCRDCSGKTQTPADRDAGAGP